jgi:hypothetical protein
MTGTILQPAVSVVSMGSTLFLRRAIRFAAHSLFALLMATVIYIPLQQRLLRHRAERLLADIHGLQMGKSTWLDAQQLISQWGAWGKYEGTCTAKRCSYQIELDDAIEKLNGRYTNTFVLNFWNCCVNWIAYPYEFLGGKTAMVFGRFEVINGTVWAKDYTLIVYVWSKDDPDGYQYLLMGRAATVWRTSGFNAIHNPAHPEYVIGRPGGCEGCSSIYTRYTPYADPNDVNALLEFNLDCLTRRSSCLDVKDIMPSVTVRYEEQNKIRDKTAEANHDPSDICSSSPEFLGRDQANVVLTQVDSVQKDTQRKKDLEVSFRLIQPLKRGTHWKSGNIMLVTVADDWLARQTADHGSIVGKKFILPFEGLYPDVTGPYMNVGPCGPIPMTEQNLGDIKRGIQKDIFPESRYFWP